MYQKPTINILRFDVEEIVRTSPIKDFNDPNADKNGWT